MQIKDLEIGKEYLRTHAYAGQTSQHIKVLSINDEVVTTIQTYPTETYRGGGKYYEFNKIECERYIHPL